MTTKKAMFGLAIVCILYSLTAGYISNGKPWYLNGMRMNVENTVHQLDSIPKFNTICYSLATLDSESRTNMNLVTYATAVGKKDGATSDDSELLWVVSLFKHTLSHKLFNEKGLGILQVLDSSHASICWVLGKTTGREVEKEKISKEMHGISWVGALELFKGVGAEAGAAAGLPAALGDVRVLPGCRAYLVLERAAPLQDVGDHDLALCRVLACYGPPPPADDAVAVGEGGGGVETLQTGELRARGII